jgi:DNA polymerase (family 10)
LEKPKVAQVLEEIADLLDIQGENSYRVRAYRNAGRTIHDLSSSLSQMPPEKLEELVGIGKDLAGKIETILNIVSGVEARRAYMESKYALERNCS